MSFQSIKERVKTENAKLDFNLKERLKNRAVAQQTYAVNEVVWKFLQKLYGGGPEVIYKEKSGSFIVSDIDKFSDTNDTFARSIKSEVLDSLRNSILDLDRTMKFDNDNPFKPMRMPNYTRNKLRYFMIE